MQGSHMPHGNSQLAELAQQQANEMAFDPAAVNILEEAVSLEIVPPFRWVHALHWSAACCDGF